MDRQAQAEREQGWTKKTTIRHHLPCHDRSQLARDAVLRVYHGRLSSGMCSTPATAALTRCCGKRRVRAGRERDIVAKNTETTKSLRHHSTARGPPPPQAALRRNLIQGAQCRRSSAAEDAVKASTVATEEEHICEIWICRKGKTKKKSHHMKASPSFQRRSLTAVPKE